MQSVHPCVALETLVLSCGARFHSLENPTPCMCRTYLPKSRHSPLKMLQILLRNELQLKIQGLGCYQIPTDEL